MLGSNAVAAKEDPNKVELIRLPKMEPADEQAEQKGHATDGQNHHPQTGDRFPGKQILDCHDDTTKDAYTHSYPLPLDLTRLTRLTWYE